jgi:hypothetical protein
MRRYGRFEKKTIIVGIGAQTKWNASEMATTAGACASTTSAR